MLVLGRRPQETIVLDGSVTITVVEVRGNRVRLGIEAPSEIDILRGELRHNPVSEAGGKVTAGRTASVT